MSLQALNIGASGMISHSDQLGVVSNNLANVNTDGFKRSRANFSDLLYQVVQAAGGEGDAGPGLGVSFGVGSRISSTQLDFSQGPLRGTGRSLDVAISGPGFFEVADNAGNTFYTRAGNFSQNADGQLTLPTGSGDLIVQPPIAIPADGSSISISEDGTVSATQGNQTVVLGQLDAVNFINPEGLLQVGDNLYAGSGASGDPQAGQFGANGFAVLAQGFLEGSNVEPTNELVDLITSQRGFSLSAESFRVANEELELVTGLNN